jgi:hypothetical protein
MAINGDATPFMPPEVAAELARLRQDIAGKESAIAQSVADRASLIDEEARLCVVLNENRRLAAVAEPHAADFPEVADWHAAVRQWRAIRSELDKALALLEPERNRLINQTIPAATLKIGGHRVDLAQLKFDQAKVEHLVAQQSAKRLAERVFHFELALGAAKQA